MSDLFFALTVLSMLIVVGILAVGMTAMAKGGDFNKKYGNKLMRLRVLMQGVALLFLALTIVTK